MSSNKRGIEYWRSLEQLAEAPEVLEAIGKEFPNYSPEEMVGTSRRRFMKLMGASMALAGVGLTGCRRWPKEKIAPYSSAPKDRTPGVPEQYATVWELGGVATGLLVTSYDGRPIKVEGNPSHPFAATWGKRLGATTGWAQASVLEMYDPERSRAIVQKGADAATWDEVQAALAGLKAGGGAGMAFLMEPSSSPSVADMRRRLAGAMPQAQWYEYEPVGRDNEIAGLRAAYGRGVRPRLWLEKADVVVSLDADLLGTHPASLRYANDWVQKRKSGDGGHGMSRVYVAESMFSITGTVADERVSVRPSRIGLIAAALAAAVGVGGAGAAEGLEAAEQQWVASAAADLKRAGRNGVVAAGLQAAPEIHAVVAAINAAIGAVGNTVTLHEEPEAQGVRAGVEGLKQLVAAMTGGQIKSLLIIGGNPAYDAPADLEFEKALAGVPLSAHLSVYNNETSKAATWHLPRAHYLESWGDGRAWDGTASVQQPLIQPLFGGKSAVEVLAMVLGDNVTDGEMIVRRTFAETFRVTDQAAWRKLLHDGVLEGSALPAANAGGAPKVAAIPAVQSGGMEVRFQLDAKVYDGRFANNGWLQETPDTLSKLTWDNAAYISKPDADKLGVRTGDVITVSAGGKSLEIVAYILPGQPVGVIGLPLGYGRSAAGSIGTNVGFNTYTLRTTAALAFATGADAKATGRKYKLASTQNHHIIDEVGAQGRDVRVGAKGETGTLVREATYAEYTKAPRTPHKAGERIVPLQMFEPPSQFNNPHAWGMGVDMNACIGCNACVVACVAENNVPVVGKDQVAMGRAMHWLRIDRYFKGTADDPMPGIVFQPMFCVHCENAPCEQVCPVAATVHDSEGINTMVYNRCIGTRYCSNNCPYKVRRFNYFDWHSKDPRASVASPWPFMPDSEQKYRIDDVKKMVFNPEVTVRMRGVMEKCTYCVQRIHNTTIDKRNKGQEVADFDIVTACQQACPTEALVFGNLLDAGSEVVKWHKNKRSYSVLEELNTRPRTKHLAKLRNPAEGHAAAAPAATTPAAGHG